MIDFAFIFEQPVSEHAKIVYVCLCCYSDEKGQSSPSRSEIAKKCSICVQVVDKAISELIRNKFLIKINKEDEFGGKGTNLYTVNGGIFT